MGAVLVVEDDFDVRESLVDVLVEAGFDACSAKDGRDGMLELRLQPGVGAIVLDLSMPMMDGHAFREAQLADPELADIPIIVLSGDSDAQESAVKLGAKHVLPKPCTPDLLLHALRNV